MWYLDRTQIFLGSDLWVPPSLIRAMPKENIHFCVRCSLNYVAGRTLLNTSECRGDGFSTYLCTVAHLLLQRCCETNELLTRMPKLGSNAFEKKSPLRQTIELPEKGKKYLVLQKQSPKPTVVYSGTRNLKRRPLCFDFAKQTSKSFTKMPL